MQAGTRTASLRPFPAHLAPLHGLHEAQLHHRAGVPAPPASPARPERTPSKELLKQLLNVLGVPAAVLKPKRPAELETEPALSERTALPRPGPRPAPLLHSLHVLSPHRVVHPALLRVPQHLVRFPHLRETLVCSLGVVLIGICASISAGHGSIAAVVTSRAQTHRQSSRHDAIVRKGNFGEFITECAPGWYFFASA